MTKKTANVGELSELYTFLRLANDSKLYVADENMEKVNDNVFFPIIKITREETKGSVFDYYTDQGQYINIYLNGEFKTRVKRVEFFNNAELILAEMKSMSKESRKYVESASFREFLSKIYVEKFKADSKHKTDINLEILDRATSYPLNAGFSIKSQMGAASTLFNASKATNYKFMVTNMNDELMNSINAIDTRNKIQDRMSAISKIGDLFPMSLSSNVFFDNLQLVDSLMPDILAFMLKIHYLTNVKSVEEVVNILIKRNPLNYHNPKIYAYKVKKLLCAFALGMVASEEWEGYEDANGGYIIVKDNGDIVAYYMYNRNIFEDYLLKNTIFDHPSTSRHEYCQIFKEENSYYMNLNLQIRFKA